MSNELAVILQELDEKIEGNNAAQISRQEGKALIKAIRAVLDKVKLSDLAEEISELRRRIGDLEKERGDREL